MTVYYLPSCKYKAAHTESGLKIQKYLKEAGAEICGCCRISQNLFGKDDIVLTNCSSCALITDEQSPQAKEISIYEYLLDDPAFPWPDHHGERITVQDCYRTINKPETQKAVRSCLQKMNMVPVEIEENYEKTRFDGTFRYLPISKSNLLLAPAVYQEMNKNYIEILPAEEQKKRLTEWVKQYTTSRVTVYCNSCLKGVLLGGADGIHILDLITAEL